MLHTILHFSKRVLALLFFTFILSLNSRAQITVNGSVPASGDQFGVCQHNNSFVFAAAYPASVVSYLWDFGDGTTSTSSAPTHSYTNAGIYKVELYATGSTSVTEYNQTVYVYPTPTVSFDVIKATSNGNAYTFISTSSVTSGLISNYYWSFGDGSGDIISNPNKIYAAAGNYSIQLIVKSDQGCMDSTIQSAVIDLTGSVVHSAFSVNASSQCINSNNFSFTNTSDQGNSESYTWDFGDGNSSNSYSTSHVYATAGSYTVVLKVKRGSDSSLAVQYINVDAKPVANFNSTVQGLTIAAESASSITSGSIATYNWDFGDNSTAQQQSIQHTYASTGNYSIKLVVASQSGCLDSITHSVSLALPVSADVASFTTNTPMCLYQNSFQFTNTSVINGTGASYAWDFGDGSTDITVAPLHSFLAAGDYTVSLTITSTAGTATTSQVVRVYPQPQVSFGITHSNTDYSFTNNTSIASGSIASYSWTSTSGNIGSGNNFNETVAPGSYSVKLVAVSDNGCSDSVTNNYSLSASLSASFSINGQLATCYTNSNTYSFVNTSTTGQGINYSWDFGDGNTDNQFQPTHQYAGYGTYIVKLTVSNATESISATQTIDLYPLPTASYILYLDTRLTDVSHEVKLCFTPGIDFSYMSSSTLAKGKMHYQWSFATNAIHFRDGDSVDYINPRVVWDTAGTYPVKLRVVTDRGCVDSFTSVVKLSDPHAHFDYSVDYGGDVYANPVVNINEHSYDYGAILTNWNWTYGDGATSVLQNAPSHHYTCGGNYNLALTVTSEVPCFNSISSVVTIRIKPKAEFSISLPNYTPNVYARPTFTFTDATTANDACPNFQYNWNFGDGATSNSSHPTHIFKGSGTYNVQLIVTNANGGLKDTISHSVTVAIKPKALFTTNLTHSPSVSFTNTSSSTDTAAVVNSLTYAWDFGDGSTSNVKSPSAHLYAWGADFTVTLTVTNPISGLQDVYTRVITVHIKPQANYSIGSQVYSPNAYAQPSITFTNSSSVADSHGSLTYSWDFGDGATSTSTSPSHVFKGSGVYSVTLIATNSNGGLQDVSVQNVTVAIKPNAQFSLNSGSNPTISFTNTSSSTDTAVTTNALNYSWDFGDGSTSLVASPSAHLYASGGDKTIALTVTNPISGLQDVFTTTITIRIAPQASFTIGNPVASPDDYGQPAYTFTNTTSVNDLAANLTYAWDFGDLSASTVASPTHTYTNSGVYQLKLIVTNQNGGLTNESDNSVTVVYKPKASFSSSLNYNGDNYSNPVVEFTNTSTISDATNTLVYAWDFGDGVTSAAVNPTHSYSDGGTYAVTLTVSNTVNGVTVSDVSISSVTVSIKPKASISVASSADPDDIASTWIQFSADNAPNPAINSSIAAGSLASYSWVVTITQLSTGNVFTQTSTNPQITFTTGTPTDYQFSTQLIVTSALGVSDTSVGSYQNGGVGTNVTGFNTPVSVPSNQVIKLSDYGNTPVNLFPNPVVSNLNINTTSDNAGIVKYQIVNVFGQVLRQGTYNGTPNTSVTFAVDVASLTSGIYFLQALNGSNQIIGSNTFIKN